MLPKPQRLNLKKDFKWVAAGKKIESKSFKLFTKIGENELARVGIALSGKSFKKAVDRNRARRLTSQAFQELYLKLPSTINIVALPKVGILDVKSEDLFLELEKIFKYEKIIS